jgi:hypothetical protein
MVGAAMTSSSRMGEPAEEDGSAWVWVKRRSVGVK